MKQALNLSLVSFFLLISIFLFQSLKIETPLNRDIRNEESAAKQEWEMEMLRDPSIGKIPEGIRYKELSFFHEMKKNSQKRGQNWRLRGPWNVGGRTRGMAVDYTNENHLVVGSVSGGLWQSWDGGINWDKVSMPNDHPGVVSIAQDQTPGRANIWYALSGEIYGTSAAATGAFYLGDGAFRSLDNGHTWLPLGSTNLGTPNSFSTNFQGGWRIVSSAADTSIYMATYGGVYRSKDTGNSWQIVIGNGNNSYFSDVAVSPSGIVYVALSSGNLLGGFYRSPDGINFTDITPASFDSINRSVIEIDPNNENRVFFLSELGCKTCGVTTSNYEGTPEYVSLLRYNYLSGNGSNAGGQWNNLSYNLPIYSGNQFDKFNCQGGYDLCIRVQPGNSNNIIIGGTNLYLSTDGFSSTTRTKQIGGYGIATSIPFFTVYPNHHPDQHDIIFLKNQPGALYSISDGGVKKTSNFLAKDVSWEDRSLGYVTAQVYTLNIDQQTAGNQRMMLGLQDNGNYISFTNNAKQHWVMPVNGDGSFGYISPKNNFYVTSLQLGRIVKIALDERGHLRLRRRIDPTGKEKSDYSFIHPFIVDPNNEDLMYLPIGRKIYRLSNLKSIALNNDYTQLENEWQELPDSLTTSNYAGNGSVITGKISCIEASNSPANVVYVGTNNRELYRIDNAHSANPILTKLSVARLPLTGNVNDIAIDPDDANKVLICFSNYGVYSLFYSANGGVTWQYAGGNLEMSGNNSGADPSVRSVAILKRKDGSKVYFAGTSIGLFSTSNLLSDSLLSGNKTEWMQESPELIGANIVTDIKVRQSDGYVAIGTHGNGAFESYYESNDPFPEGNLAPISNQIFPNPATDRINYSFTLDVETDVLLELYNASGAKMKVLNKGHHLAGSFNYSFDVSGMPNGIYLLAFEDLVNKQRLVQKIVIRN